MHKAIIFFTPIGNLDLMGIGTLNVPLTGGSDRWAVETTEVRK